MTHTILTGDVMNMEPEGKFHAILCDPPYELGFMGKDWDKTGLVFKKEVWERMKDHLHDGGFLMAFASSRGWHRLAVAIEDAGFIIHPTIFGWSFGSGFPKATRIDTQVDKMAGVEREVIGQERNFGISKNKQTSGDYAGEWDITAPATSLAKSWVGHRYGLQALKPALEPIIVAQKPYKGKPVENITRTGAGALWIDGGRIGTSEELGRNNHARTSGTSYVVQKEDKYIDNSTGKGRWPSNLILYHTPECRQEGVKKVKGGSGWSKTGSKESENTSMSGKNYDREPKPDNYEVDKNGNETIPNWVCHPDCPVSKMDKQSGVLKSGAMNGVYKNTLMANKAGVRDGKEIHLKQDASEGGASRFFHQVQTQLDEADPIRYQAKASRSERDAGLDNEPERHSPYGYERGLGDAGEGMFKDRNTLKSNPHPTIKPIALAKYLATLLLPPKEYAPRRILVPFSGVGSEMIGCLQAGWEEVVGIEMSPEYVEIAEKRIEHYKKKILDEPPALL